MHLTPYNIRKGIRYLKHYGLHEFLIRFKEKNEPENLTYEEFRKIHRLQGRELRQQEREYKLWMKKPLSICYFANEMNLSDITIESKATWILCVKEGIRLDKYAQAEFMKAAYQPGKVMQSGVHWDMVDNPDFIYADADEYSESEHGETQYINPKFKPDYNMELQKSTAYIGAAFLISREIYDKVRNSMQAWQGWLNFQSRCIEEAKGILHIPKVLYHEKHQDNIEKDVYKATAVEMQQASGYAGQPLISIIIPNKDEVETLKTCLHSILQSTYTNYEIIIVENNSTNPDTFSYYRKLQEENEQIQVVTFQTEQGFNYSAINNYGVSFAQGEYLVLLNNDIELITTDWLERMLVHCQQPKNAIVGARLYYPDDTIQHAGIMVGIGGHARGVAINMYTGLPREEAGYMKRASAQQNLSAVTAACMMIKKCVFEEVGGFHEYLTVAFNDVDLCLKARKAGYLVVYDPSIEAYHYESKSRGQEDTEEKVRRFQTEIEYMRTQWNDILRYGDPYYNPNLTRNRCDYSLRGDN